MNKALHGLVEQRLRQVSQRYTSGRREVVELLADAGHPVSIEDIAERAPRLPRSSAYRHLVDLQLAGVVRRVAANDDYFRFELAEDITEHHHHLLCTTCGRVIDVTPTPAFEEAMTKYLDSLANVNGFETLDHRLDVHWDLRRLPRTGRRGARRLGQLASRCLTPALVVAAGGRRRPGTPRPGGAGGKRPSRSRPVGNSRSGNSRSRSGGSGSGGSGRVQAQNGDVGTIVLAAAPPGQRRHDPRIDQPTRADRRRLWRWAALLAFCPICLGVVVWAALEHERQLPDRQTAGPVRVAIGPWHLCQFLGARQLVAQAVPERRFGRRLITRAPGGGVGESVTQADRAPTAHGPLPEIVGTFLGWKYQVTSVRRRRSPTPPWPGATASTWRTARHLWACWPGSSPPSRKFG